MNRQNIVCDRRRHRYYLAILFILSLWVVPVRAQYSSETFELKKASDLYDERGFNKGQTINVDGNMAVSPINGNVSYKYTLDKFTRQGYGFDLSLSYCGSVSMVSFGKYNTGVTSGSESGLVTGDSWQKFTQNKPLWIIGFNGFAVQTFCLTSDYIRPPYSEKTTWSDNEYGMDWLVEGYDVCNRMQWMNDDGDYDIIRLLRADGSTLELRNGYRIGDVVPAPIGINPVHLTGHYFEDAVNPTGFAVVEYDTTNFNSKVDSMVTAIKEMDGEAWQNAAGHFMPRIVRYYPGDGLEYVFREHQIPFGLDRYQGDQTITGGMVAGPTIFYLREVNDARGSILSLNYSRHRNPDDDSPGRALLRNISDYVEFTYGDNFATVQSRGRTISLRLENNIPFTDYEYRGGDRKYSYIGRIKEILDPEKRSTRFNYQMYTRSYHNYKYPYTTADVMNTTSYRINRITEPAAQYDITYYNGTLSTLDAEQSNPYAMGAIDWRLSNVATEVQKRSRSNELLTTETYCFRGIERNWQGNCDGLEQAGTLYNIVDHKTGKTKDIDYLIWKREIDRYRGRVAPDPLAIPLVHTEIIGTAEVADGIRRTTETAFDTVGCRFLILPWRTLSAVTNSGGGPVYLTSYNKIQYQTDTVRGFTGLAEARRLFTRKATQKKEVIYNPADTTEVLMENYTDFLHLPFRGDTLVTEALVVWNKFASLHRYDSLRAIGALTGRWEDMPANLHIYDTITTTGKNPPPFYGLVKEQYSKKDGVYLGGKKMVYNETLNDTAYTRGLLMRDSIISRERETAVLGNRYSYSNGQYYADRLPITIENAYGARKELVYNIPWSVQTGTATADDGTTTAELLYNRSLVLGLEKPNVEKQTVRNARTLTTDTLQTVNEHTFYGLVSATRDMNGHYSRFNYDNNGRIKAAWLPKDFFGQDTACTEHYTGALDYPLWGHTAYHIEIDSIECDDVSPHPPLTNPVINGTIIFSPLKAAMYRRAARDCDGGPYPMLGGEIDKPTTDEHRSNSKQPKPLGTMAIHHHIGTITVEDDIIRLPFVTTGADNIFAQALAMNTAYFQFYITSMAGNCFTMEVRIIEDTPSSPGDTILTQQYSMNCPSLTALTALSGGVSGKKGAMDGHILAGPAPLDYLFRVNIKPKLTEIKTAGVAYVEIRVVTAGAAMEIAAEGEDKRPRFVLDGEFDRPHPLSDFTLAYDYAPDDRTVTVRSKTDDKYNTASAYPDDCTYARRSKTEHQLGADHRLEKTLSFIGNPDSPLRTDTVAVTSSGVGLKLKSFDQLRDSVATEYDAWGRPVKVVNADSTYATMEYSFGTALAMTGDNDQNFYGYCEKTLSTVYDTSEFAQYKAIQYTDAFGRLRREEIGESMNLKTKYEYDEQSRLITVVNPAGDTTRYWYDNFGRIKYKYQPDMGYISYAYDKLGQVRFVQTQQQANEGKMTFTEYDDLGRVTLVGETKLTSATTGDGGGDGGNGGGKGILSGTGNSEAQASLSPVAIPTVDKTTVRASKREQALSFPPHDPGLKLDRLTDFIDPSILHDDGVSTSPTANESVWLALTDFLPSIGNSQNIDQTSECIPYYLSGDTVFPFLYHPVVEYSELSVKLSDSSDFENIALYPFNARIAVHYDELPTSSGSIWLYFPNRGDWENLAPHRLIRNTKGRETAVAYRTHVGEPYHYVVMSYDERGRVEALLRYTENLGFDAVYYTYNSMNAITSITAADPLRQYTTWYGYNHNGQVDSVWTKLSVAGQGLGVDSTTYPTPQTKPTTADIVYDYTKRGQINTMSYPPVNTVVSYAYNHRAFLDSMVAEQSGTMTFRQKLMFDAQGRIAQQRSQHSGQTEVLDEYQYDYRGQLTNTSENRNGVTTTQTYEYDPVGNRTFQFDLNPQPVRSWYSYTDANGPNRLSTKRDSTYQSGSWTQTGLSNYKYNADGAMTSRMWKGGLDSINETFVYDNVQGLVKKYLRTTNSTSEDWRYRYSAGGEREQKRQYRTQGATPAPGELDWTYYLLDGSKRQLAVYEGVVTKQTSCGSTAEEMVYLYPVEYLSYGQGSVHNLTARPVSPTTGEKEYKLQDHLGSTRMVIHESGTVTNRTDNDAWGKIVWQSGAETRKGFIDKEKDAESGDHNFGVRQYSPENGGRFGSIDPLWENYRSLTPYQYTGNNPVIFVDPSGLALDLRGMTFYDDEKNTTTRDDLVNDLTQKTGLTLYTEGGMLKYKTMNDGSPLIAKDQNGNLIGSSTARDFIMRIIDRTDVLEVNIDDTQVSIAEENGSIIRLNPNDIGNYIAGAQGVDPTTMGWGMTFIHEAGHTQFGGNLRDIRSFDVAGPVEDKIVNVIRKELDAQGGNYGQRMSYMGFIIGNTAYIPFTPLAQFKLKQGKIPATGYISIPK